MSELLMYVAKYSGSCTTNGIKFTNRKIAQGVQKAATLVYFRELIDSKKNVLYMKYNFNVY